MASLKKYDLTGKEVDSVEISDELLHLEGNAQMIKDYLVAIRNNKRQWSAKTKDRSEVKCTTKKPHAQKGSGNARQGSFVSPQYRGGGVVFGPRPKFDQHVRINKKEKRLAIKTLLSQIISDGKLSLLQMNEMAAPKTKVVQSFMKERSLGSRKVLFLAEAEIQQDEVKDQYVNFVKSMRNIPKINFKRVMNVNGYDLAYYDEVIVLEKALGDLQRVLGEESK